MSKKAAQTPKWDLADYRPYPLVDGMFLHAARDVSEREARRFAAIFAAVWLSLPAVWRNRIRRFWQAGEDRRQATLRRAAASGTTRRPWGPPVVPFISLDTESIEQLVFGGKRRGTTQAITTDRGLTIRFLAHFVKRAPPEPLIAHELAHLTQAVGRHDPQAILPDCDACETQADDVAWGWGYSLAMLDAWENEHVERWEHGLPVFKQRHNRSSKPNGQRPPTRDPKPKGKI